MGTAIIERHHSGGRQPAAIPESSEPAVSPEQVWGLLTRLQQQQVMRVLSQAGRILVQSAAKETCDEHR